MVKQVSIDPVQVGCWWAAAAVCFGVVFGLLGLGLGLVLMDVVRGIGLGILFAGFGALFSVYGGDKKILRAIITTIREMEAENE